MRADIWMPLYIGDYLGDTQHLNAEKHGIYLLLMMHYWKQGSFDNDIEELSCVAKTTEDKVLKILKSFFLFDNNKWKHKRIDKEIASATARSDAARANAKKRWDKQKGCDGISDGISDGNATAYAESMPIVCSSHSQSPSYSETQSSNKNKPKKHKHGEYKNVLLSDSEFEKIGTRFGEAERDGMISRLDEGIELKGYKYKSHYLALLKWNKKDEGKVKNNGMGVMNFEL